MAHDQKTIQAIDFGHANEKQKLFYAARTRYIAYGGARGGGKTHAIRIKAVGGAIYNPGIKILIVRREYPELLPTIIMPLRKMIPSTVAEWNGSIRMFTFWNESIIKVGHYGANDDLEYQGQEWDWIFMDEATQFTEDQFTILGACLRGSVPMRRCMYLTCNPGGIGHTWVKRLFVDRVYNEDNDEHAEDYTFIRATVADNPDLMENSPEYVSMLKKLPEDRRRAWLNGDWDALGGYYFPECCAAHRFDGFTRLPKEWKKYRVIDYGLDMLAVLWIAVDFDGRCYVYREYHKSGLIVSEAARALLDLTPEGEQIECTIGPPDMRNRQKDNGKSMAELFAENGVPLIFASNNRIHGWMAVKEMLKPMKHERDKPGLLVSKDCPTLWYSLTNILADKKNPNDCATEPHSLTHACDSLRYFCVTRTLGAELPDAVPEPEPYDTAEEYDDVMTGGEAGDDYLAYGA